MSAVEGIVTMGSQNFLFLFVSPGSPLLGDGFRHEKCNGQGAPPERGVSVQKKA